MAKKAKTLSVVIYDPTDFCKPHSHKMEKLSLVRDASRSSRATSRDGGSRSPASEEARDSKRRSDLRTQPAVLSRQGRLNEVRCLR